MSVVTLLLRRKPGVSMAMNALPSSSKRTSTLSRVVPGTSLTIIRSAWASVLTSVLLPTFRRPTMATFITGVSGDVLAGGHLRQRSAMASISSALPRFSLALTRIIFRPKR